MKPEETTFLKLKISVSKVMLSSDIMILYFDSVNLKMFQL